MSRTLYEFADYRDYLSHVLRTTGKTRGTRSRLARRLRCQTAFVSQVLKRKLHFGLEHAFAVSHFLKHDDDERQFFMLLVQKGRAGSSDLEGFFGKQITKILEERSLIKRRIRAEQKLSSDHQITYYSSWYYAAIHVLLSIPKFQDKRELADALKLPLPLVSQVLDFLVRAGLAIEKGDRFLIGPKRTHLESSSILIAKHHTNWRMRAISSLDMPDPAALHYSAAITLSKEDAKMVRELSLSFIEQVESILTKSPEESGLCFNLDFFPLFV